MSGSSAATWRSSGSRCMIRAAASAGFRIGGAGEPAARPRRRRRARHLAHQRRPPPPRSSCSYVSTSVDQLGVVHGAPSCPIGPLPVRSRPARPRRPRGGAGRRTRGRARSRGGRGCRARGRAPRGSAAGCGQRRRSSSSAAGHLLLRVLAGDRGVDVLAVDAELAQPPGDPLRAPAVEAAPVLGEAHGIARRRRGSRARSAP